LDGIITFIQFTRQKKSQGEQIIYPSVVDDGANRMVTCKRSAVVTNGHAI